jgi:hypothetical protein
VNYLQSCLILCGLLAASLGANAQQPAAADCPVLPGGSDLHWEQQQRDGYVLCKALDGNGNDAFNLMLTSQEPNLHLARALRAERAQFADQSIHWYRMDLVADNSELAQYRRITVSKLGKNQYAQLWFNAGNQAEVDTRIQQIGSLRLHSTLLGNR